MVNGTANPNQKTRAEDDSKTNVYINVPMNRDVVSVRIRPEIKQALKQYCSKNGLSICHIFEGLVIGFLQGVNEQIEFVNKSPTINVDVKRAVRRARRYMDEDEEVPEAVELRVCTVCGKAAYARVVEVEGLRMLCEDDFRKARVQGLRGWKYVRE